MLSSKNNIIAETLINIGLGLSNKQRQHRFEYNIRPEKLKQKELNDEVEELVEIEETEEKEEFDVASLFENLDEEKEEGKKYGKF